MRVMLVNRPIPGISSSSTNHITDFHRSCTKLFRDPPESPEHHRDLFPFILRSWCPHHFPLVYRPSTHEHLLQMCFLLLYGVHGAEWYGTIWFSEGGPLCYAPISAIKPTINVHNIETKPRVLNSFYSCVLM